MVECGAGVGCHWGAVGRAGQGTETCCWISSIRRRCSAGAERRVSLETIQLITSPIFSLLKPLCMILVSDKHWIRFVCLLMMYSVFSFFHREKLGSSSPEQRHPHFMLTGFAPLLVATHLKDWKNISLSLWPGMIIFVLQINNLNCSVSSVCYSFKLHCSWLCLAAHVSLLCGLSAWQNINEFM